jgi:hypothetical protein
VKRISHNYRSRDPLLHIETDFGIVNIRVGLYDADGNAVTSIEIIPDQDGVPYAPNRRRAIELDGFASNRLIARTVKEDEHEAT